MAEKNDEDMTAGALGDDVQSPETEGQAQDDSQGNSQGVGQRYSDFQDAINAIKQRREEGKTDGSKKGPDGSGGSDNTGSANPKKPENGSDGAGQRGSKSSGGDGSKGQPKDKPKNEPQNSPKDKSKGGAKEPDIGTGRNPGNRAPGVKPNLPKPQGGAPGFKPPMPGAGAGRGASAAGRAGRAGQTAAKAGKAAASGAKAARAGKVAAMAGKALGALGPVIIIVIIVIVVLLLLIGVIGFFAEMPGMMNAKINKAVDSFTSQIGSWFYGEKTKHDDTSQEGEQWQLAEYLESMGYPIYQNGFGQYYEVVDNGKQWWQFWKSDREGIKPRGSEKNAEKGYKTIIDSKYLNTYLTANYATYEFEDNFSKAINDLGEAGTNMFDWLFHNKDDEFAQFGMLKIDDDPTNLLDHYDSDPATKTMTFTTRHGFAWLTAETFTYNMDGWSGRYGKPMELSLTMHLATMAPDLVYTLDTTEGENTKIHIKLNKYKTNIKFKYQVTDKNVDTKFADLPDAENFGLTNSDKTDSLDTRIHENGSVSGDDLSNLQKYIDENNDKKVKNWGEADSNLTAFLNAKYSSFSDQKYWDYAQVKTYASLPGSAPTTYTTHQLGLVLFNMNFNDSSDHSGVEGAGSYENSISHYGEKLNAYLAKQEEEYQKTDAGKNDDGSKKTLQYSVDPYQGDHGGYADLISRSSDTNEKVYVEWDDSGKASVKGDPQGKIAKGYFAKAVEISNSKGIKSSDEFFKNDSAKQELFEYLQKELKSLRDGQVQKDLDKVPSELGSENLVKLKTELDKIGLTMDAIKQAVKANNTKGEGEGMEVEKFEPRITEVTLHWFRDVVFEGTYNGEDYNAYTSNESEIISDQVFNPGEGSDQSSMVGKDGKGEFHVLETKPAGSTSTQVKDAIRGQLNPYTKWIFNQKYFIYDGSKGTADLIEAIKAKVLADYNAKGHSATDVNQIYKDAFHFSGDIYNDSAGLIAAKDKAQKALDDAIEAVDGQTLTYNGQTFKDVNIGLVYKVPDVRKNAYSAFAILENTHTEDAEFILRDLKNLFVELGYFKKKDMIEKDTHVMAWPYKDYKNSDWPTKRYEIQQIDHGVLMRSKYSTDNLKQNKNADGSDRTDEQKTKELYPASFKVVDQPKKDDNNSNQNDNNKENSNSSLSTLPDGFDNDIDFISPVTGKIVGEGSEDGVDYIDIQLINTDAIKEYAAFYKKYAGICEGFTLRIKGIKKGDINSDTKNEYKTVEKTDKWFIKQGYGADYREVKKDKEEYDKLEKERKDAKGYLEVNGERYVKEGTILGKTTTSDIVLYLKDREGKIVENVQDYINVPEKKDCSSAVSTGNYSVTDTVFSKEEFTQLVVNYANKVGAAESWRNSDLVGQAYDICKQDGINPEFWVGTAIIESSLRNLINDAYNYYGLSNHSGPLMPGRQTYGHPGGGRWQRYDNFLDGVHDFCEFIKCFTTEGTSQYNAIMKIYNERKDVSGMPGDGYGLPSSLPGILSVYVPKEPPSSDPLEMGKYNAEEVQKRTQAAITVFGDQAWKAGGSSGNGANCNQNAQGTVGSLEPKLVLASGTVEHGVVNTEASNVRFSHKTTLTGPGYIGGGCTEWAWSRLTTLGKSVYEFLGDGGNWKNTAGAHGAKVGYDIKPGNAISCVNCLGGTTHIMVIEEVRANGDIIVSEGAYGTPTVRTRLITKAQLDSAPKSNWNTIEFPSK